MGDVTRIDTGAFNDTINKIDNAIAAFSSTKTTIVNSTDKLMATWEGKGEEAFSDAYKILKKELKDEVDNLKAVKDDLVMIRDSYEGWDESLKTSFAEQTK